MPTASPNFTPIKLVPKGTERRRGVVMLAGPSNSGKTRSALRMAVGLQQVLGGRIALLDTEQRGNLYEQEFDFDRWVMSDPFHPEAFVRAYDELDERYSVVITDNFSDEWEGVGGLLEMADGDGNQHEAGKWAKPKAAHRRLMSRVRLLKSQHIFCLRAKDKVRITDGKEPGDNGKKKVQPLGWLPICEPNFIYDVTLGFMLPPNSKGRAEIAKTIEAFDGVFVEGRQIDEEYGRALGDWIEMRAPAKAGVARPAASKTAYQLRDEDGKVLAVHGTAREAWLAYLGLKARSDPEKVALRNLDLLRLVVGKTSAGPSREAVEREIAAVEILLSDTTGPQATASDDDGWDEDAPAAGDRQAPLPTAAAAASDGAGLTTH